MKPNFFCLIIVTVLMSSCAWMSGGSGRSTKSGVPKTSQIQKPGGSGDNWRYLGTTDDGILVDEIDSKSINSGTSSQNTQVFNFQDRKTVVIPNQFSYPNDQPHFKYLISSWQMNCSSKEYLLNSATLYNESGVKLTHYNYGGNNEVKWLKLGSSSFAEMQYEFICLNTNRNLGY